MKADFLGYLPFPVPTAAKDRLRLCRILQSRHKNTDTTLASRMIIKASGQDAVVQAWSLGQADRDQTDRRCRYANGSTRPDYAAAGSRS